MTDLDGYRIEAALECGFEMTNDDGDEFRCTEAQIIDLMTRAEIRGTNLYRRPPEKRAPVQGLAGGIPWSMHLKAYEAYCKKYGAQQALIDLEGRGCRGGFGTEELDMFIPGWRDELAELTKMRVALVACADQFKAYGVHHMAKSPPDSEKARRNYEMFAMCEQLLTPVTA